VNLTENEDYKISIKEPLMNFHIKGKVTRVMN